MRPCGWKRAGSTRSRRPAGDVSQVPRAAVSAIQSWLQMVHQLGLGEERRERTRDVVAARGVEAGALPAEPRDAHEALGLVVDVPPVEAVPVPTAMPCGATPRASSTTFSAAPAFAPAGWM